MKFGPMLPVEMAIDTAKALPKYTRAQYRNARLLGLSRRNAARFALGQAMRAAEEVANLMRSRPHDDDDAL